ncbi:MAG: peptide chain release factor 2, partial [Actinomycetota bacterium]|nr:peptide chain release factor 2 [Actinomycetota bacterium]
RSSSAGGQHVNVTDSAVRITHLPTGLTAACQNERSQMQNKAVAMRILKARLAEQARQEHAQKLEDIRGEHQNIDFGSQIRSYVLHPYRMVKDHRTGVETGDVDRVLDGDLRRFIEAYLRWRAGGAGSAN